MGNSTSSMHNVAGDISEKLDDLRSKALKNLHDMLSTFGKPIPTVSDDELDTFKLQVENRMLLVAFVGEGSAGKSTLINAILRDEFLPYGCERTTNLRIYIKHNSNIHIGRCQEGSPCERCPKLCENLGGKSGKQKKLCTGVNAISKQISLRNKEAENIKVTVVLVIEANVEMFKGLTLLPNAQSHTVYIVDCPGMECLREDTMEFFSITSQMIYILNYSRFLQDREKVVKELHEKPSSAQLLFAVTYFDVYYTPGTGKENPDENKVKQLVSKAFNDVQENDVFPLCGKWVLNAYLLKKLPNDSDSQLVVKKAYEEYMRRLTENSSSMSEQNHMIDTILKIGGVQALEDRIRQLVDNTDLNHWNKVICNQAEMLLRKPIKAAKDLLEEIEKECEALKKKVDAGKIKDRKINEALDHIRNNCKKRFVTGEINDNFKIEDFLSNVYPELVTTLNTFKDQCYRKVQASACTVAEFDKEFKIFKEEKIPNKIKEIYNKQSLAFFLRQKEVLREKLRDVVSLLEIHIFNTDYSNVELMYPESPESPESPKSPEIDNVRLHFCDPLKSKREIARSQRFYHLVKSAASVGGGTGVAGITGAIKILPVVGALLPAIVAAPVAVGGLSVGLAIGGYQVYRAWNTVENKLQLSEADLEKIHEQSMEDINSEYNKDVLMKYFADGKALYYQKPCEDIVETAQKLWDSYQKDWKEHHEKFTKKLDLAKNEARLKRITEEKSTLKLALDELERVDAFLKEIVNKISMTFEDTD